jgi:hypothetical protein
VPVKTETADPVCAEDEAGAKASAVMVAPASIHIKGEGAGGMVKPGDGEDGVAEPGAGGALKLGEGEVGGIKQEKGEVGAVKLEKGEIGGVKLGEGEVGGVKLGKRSAAIHARAEELLVEMAKRKHEGVEASVLNRAAKVEPPEKAPKPKREKR